MRKIPLTILMAAVTFAVWPVAHGDERLDAVKPPTNSANEPKKQQRATEKPAAEAGDDAETHDETVVKAIVGGKVLLLGDALKLRHIKSYVEEIKGQVVLVTKGGEMVPIVPDWRGRALFQDERLRNRPVDLVVNRRPGVPWVQVLSIYTFDDKGVRNITDYWCDICAIPMYEIKECECCQGPTRLRFRPQELPKDIPPARDVDAENSRNPHGK